MGPTPVSVLGASVSAGGSTLAPKGFVAGSVPSRKPCVSGSGVPAAMSSAMALLPMVPASSSRSAGGRSAATVPVSMSRPISDALVRLSASSALAVVSCFRVERTGLCSFWLV